MLFREEKKYLELVNEIIENGYDVDNDRTKVGTKVINNQMMTFDISDGKIPIISTRKLPLKFLMVELMWFIKGLTDISYLKEKNVNIWDDWVLSETIEYEKDIYSDFKKLEEQGVIKLSDDFKKTFKQYDFSLISGILESLTGKTINKFNIKNGSIGNHGYGAMWRRLEEVRYIEEHELLRYQYKGFEVIKEVEDNKQIESRTPILNDNNEVIGYHEESCNKDIKKYVVRKYFDQLNYIINLINNDPHSRRIVLSSWNIAKLDEQALPPCHMTYIVNVRVDEKGKKYLNPMLICRSQDLLVGTVANIAQYSMLTHILARLTNSIPETLTWVGANVHVYKNQIELAKQQIDRLPYKNTIRFKMPEFNFLDELEKLEPDMFTIEGYDNYHNPIKYPVAV